MIGDIAGPRPRSPGAFVDGDVLAELASPHREGEKNVLWCRSGTWHVDPSKWMNPYSHGLGRVEEI